jgi:hypothetical protein
LNNFYTRLQQSLGHNTVKYSRSTAEKICCILLYFWFQIFTGGLGNGFKIPVRTIYV